jgi:ribosomal protein S15P/S13E
MFPIGPFIFSLPTVLQPLATDAGESIDLPDVRYIGRCPSTNLERALRPTPEVIAAAAHLKRYLASRRQAATGFSTCELYAPFTGKMFGIMLCRDATGQLGTLRAFSGGWAGQWQPPGWVPPSSHVAEYATQRTQTEAQLAILTQQINALKAQPPDADNTRAIADCKTERRRISRILTDQIHQAYRFENFLGEILPLTAVDTGSPRPPTGMGDCCAPKLLQHAVRNQLAPLGMVEFWWGQSPPALPRVEGAYYGSCEHKCYPILGFLLRGCAAAEVGP